MRVLVRGPVDCVSGYGNDVVGLLGELSRRVEVDVWPLSVTPPLPREITRLLERPLRPPYDVVLTYADPPNLTPWELPGWGRQVGWSMWERVPLTPMSLPWWDLDHPDLAQGRVWSGRQDLRPDQQFTELWLCCRMNVDAFEGVDTATRKWVITPGVDELAWPVLPRDRDDDVVRFGSEGVLAGRKDPEALLGAWRLFRRRHPEIKAELHLKLTGAPSTMLMARSVLDVVVHAEVWPHEKLLGFYDRLDCYVSSSRGEGVNKPAVQFLCTGGPVIATGWGGHETWMFDSHAWRVHHELRDSVQEPGTVDAPVDMEDLARLFEVVALDPAGRRRRGAAGAQFVRSALSWRVVVDKMLPRLSALLV